MNTPTPPLLADNPSLNAMQGNLDTLLAAVHLLPLQKDVPGLLKILKYCCASQMQFQQICLFVETPLQENSVLYTLDVRASDVACIHVGLEVAGCCYVLSRKTEISVYDRAKLAEEFPQLVSAAIFLQLASLLLVPLPVEINGYHCALAFVKSSGSFSATDVAQSKALGAVLQATLTNILQIQEMRKETEALREERDQLNILVGVSRVITSSLHLPSIISQVFLDLKRYFATEALALELFEHDGLTLYENTSREGRHLTREGSLLAALHEATTPLALDASMTASVADPCAKSFHAQKSPFIYGFPIIFHGQLLGALFLAHRTESFFTRETVTLLTQITSILAGVLNNAREYRSMTEEADSLLDENLYLSREIREQSGQGDVLGNSIAMREVLSQVDLVASTNSTVLLLGESGTGKEVIAEAIHKRSQRAHKRMIKMNCAAMPAGLLESELFGHEKGAFTGASARSKGRFELAQGSTLMLDEVGDLPLELQPKLLRVLQERELERLGGSEVIKVDVRLIAATNQNLEEMVQKKQFRGDLFYRLNVFPIHLPPLRARREDIPILARHFVEQAAKKMKKNITRIPSDGMRWLCEQDWPGNVRELANILERAVILTSGSVLCLQPATLGGIGQSSVAKDVQEKPAVERETKQKAAAAKGTDVAAIIAAVKGCNGIMDGPRGAAALLGVKRTTLLSRMKRLGLSVKAIMEKPS